MDKHPIDPRTQLHNGSQDKDVIMMARHVVFHAQISLSIALALVPLPYNLIHFISNLLIIHLVLVKLFSLPLPSS